MAAIEKSYAKPSPQQTQAQALGAAKGQTDDKSLILLIRFLMIVNTLGDNHG